LGVLGVLGELEIGCGCFGERVKYLSKDNFVISSKGTMRGESWSWAIWSHFIDVSQRGEAATKSIKLKINREGCEGCEGEAAAPPV
jgi:hypothetical protein